MLKDIYINGTVCQGKGKKVANQVYVPDWCCRRCQEAPVVAAGDDGCNFYGVDTKHA